jgi:hypothetical protein
VNVSAPGYLSAVEKTTNDSRTVFSTHDFRLGRAGGAVLRVVRGGKPASVPGSFSFPPDARGNSIASIRLGGAEGNGPVESAAHADFAEYRSVAAGTHEATLSIAGVKEPIRRTFEVKTGEETVVDFEVK